MTGTARYAIGIGAQKCASSWLHDVLACHPGVAVAARKELDFFSYHHDRGHGWYAAQWRGPGLRFENSPSYLHDPRSPARLERFAPGAQLVVTLRDPVARAVSHHRHEIARGHAPPVAFEAALGGNPDYLEQGFYARHLARWIEAFGREALLVLLAEEIAAEPEAARRAVLRHFGLPMAAAPGMLGEARNVSDLPRSRTLRAALRQGGAALRRLGLERQLAVAKGWPPVRRVLEWNGRPVTVPGPGPGLRRELAFLYAEDMAAVAGMLGRGGLPWPSWERVVESRLRCGPRR